MSKSRIFLGGVASASILAMGAAGPALASTSQVASAASTSTFSSLLPASSQTGAPLRGVLTSLLGLPVAYSVGTPDGGVSGNTSKTPGRAVNGAVNRATGDMPDFGAVDNDLGSTNVPGLSPATSSQLSTNGAASGLAPAAAYLGSMTGAVPAVKSVTSQVPGLGR